MRKALYYSRFNPNRLLCAVGRHDYVIVPSQWVGDNRTVATTICARFYCLKGRPF